MAADSKFPLAAKIIFLIVIIFLLGFSIANAIYYKRIEENPNPPVNKSAAYAMFILNIVLIILCVVFGGCLCYFMVDKKQIDLSGNVEISNMSKSSRGNNHPEIASKCLEQAQHFDHNSGKTSVDYDELDACLKKSGSFSQSEIKRDNAIAKEIALESTKENEKVEQNKPKTVIELKKVEQQSMSIKAELDPAVVCERIPQSAKAECIDGVKKLDARVREAELNYNISKRYY